MQNASENAGYFTADIAVLRAALDMACVRLGPLTAGATGELALLVSVAAREGCHDPYSLADMALRKFNPET